MESTIKSNDTNKANSDENNVVKFTKNQVTEIHTFIAVVNNFIMDQKYSGDDILIVAEIMNNSVKLCKELNGKLNQD